MAEYEDAAKIIEKVNSKEKELDERFQRMDEDFRLWNLESVSKNYPGETKDSGLSLSAHDIEVISNDPRSFADQVQSTLSDADMQIMIRMVEQDGEDRRDAIAKLERLLHFALDMADRRLRKLLMLPFRESTIWHSIVRGWVAGRTLIYKRGGNVVFDLMPLDPRWLTFETGADGNLWTAYKTMRSRDALKGEWKYDAPKPSDNEVIDYWETVGERKFVNCVICNKEYVKKPKIHTLRSHPVTIVPVSTRPDVSTQDGREAAGYGESIFAPMRDINKTRNRFVSIVATHANLLSKQPIINYYDEMGQQIQTTVYLAEAVLNLPMEHNKLDTPPMKEIAPTVVQILNWLNEQMERVSLPHIPVGSPPPSGTLYNLVQEAGNKVYNPQLKNLSYFYEEICRQIEEQLIDSNIKVDVRYEDRKKYFETQVTPVDLNKPHFTRVEFTARTPWTQFDTYQVADMAKRLGLPDAFIHEYILKLPDPKGISDMNAIEMAEHSPKLAMIQAIKALGVAGRKDEAESVMQDLYNMVMTEQQPAQPARIGGAQPATPGQLPAQGMGGM